MEQRLVRKDIKRCDAIEFHPDYFLFSGKNLQSCSQNGGPLVTYPEVKTFLREIAILPTNKILVDDSKGVLHLLDLDAGKVLLSKKLTKKRMCQSRFATSADGDAAYCVWCWGKDWYLVKFDLSDLNYRIYKYPATLHFVGDIIEKSHDKLLVLESQVDDDGTCRNQVSSVSIRGEQCTATPVYKWHGDYRARCFDGRYVWESQYHIRDLETNRCFNLLENSDISLPQNHVALTHIYYPNENYLQLIDPQQTVFIDCEKRAIIARYRRDTREPSFIGQKVDNEFWYGTPNGIYASPFPMIEDMS